MRLRVLALGDVVGIPGRIMIQKYLHNLKKEHGIDFVIVNGENSAQDGRGITPSIMDFYKKNGVDIVTSGNHIWAKKQIYSYIAENKDLLRPVNYPSQCPGVGAVLFNQERATVGVINVLGRVFMRETAGDPFRAIDSSLTYLKAHTPVILVDIHAETTAEKAALAFYLDGRVSAVFGTHTHVPTADERILPKGTAFVSDLGMAGTINSVIGVKKDIIIQHMMSQMPAKFVLETEGPYCMSGVIIDIDTATGHALSIQRIRIDDNEATVQHHTALD